ncbi:VCBS domain-containing protein [Vibrio sp. 1180_3]|nr:VCBS domain-containing protein [Vibrio sp. 1180_3]MDF9400259.1 tandem-95 repeat protein [Vibrio sp. 1180_3]
MANKKNIETNKKSNELEQKKATQKKKLRLHSHLKVNIPLFQSLIMILPSLAKHASAEGVDNYSNEANRATENSVAEKDVTDDHGKANSSAVTHQESPTSENHVGSTLSVSHAPHGSNSHLVPSHHLSTFSHPQVHYIPSISMPTISLESNGQPTHSNNTPPTTPASPVTFVSEVIKGAYGELHVDANGQYTFVLNPNSPQYILLNQNKHGTDHFVLNLSDGSKIVVQIPVTGKQDTPTISGDLAGVVTEDHKVDSHGLLHANGKIDVIDPDQNESSMKPEVLAGKYGSLSIDADGHWQYHVDNSLSNIQALTSATSLHESFVIHTQDGTPQTLDMTIGGNDDNAVVTGIDTGAVTEESQLQTIGTLTVSDTDAGEAHFSNTDIVGTLGTLHLKDNGDWTYDLDNSNPKVQALAQGKTATDTITVHSADGTPHQITITVNGTNDSAVIAGSNSGVVTEETQLQTTGTLTVTDTDTGEAHFSDTDIVGTLGTLHLTDSGDWTYDLDNSNPKVQALAQGKTATDTITVHSADGTPHQITITVNGTNDSAVIAGTNSGAVTEESQLQTIGTLTVTDTDAGEAHFSDTDIVGTLGTLHLTDSGDWTYDLDNTNPKVQTLAQGKTATDIITVHSTDGTPHQITITVNGTNDSAVIAGTNSGAVTEESQLQTIGTLTVTDTDAGEAHFSDTDIIGSLGTLHLKDNGDWSYDLDNSNPKVQVLAQGKTATDTITVHSADGTPHQITITVNGTNDSAVIAGTNSGAVTEETQLQTTGTLTVTDTDAGEAHFSDTDIIGSLGTLHLKDNGDWSYDLDNSNPKVQALAQGKTATDTITVHSADGTPHQVTITVNGTNDSALIAGTTSGSVTEESKLHASGQLSISDLDSGQDHFQSTDIKGAYGSLHIDTDGLWTYDLDNSTVQALGDGDKLSETLTVNAADGTPHDIKVWVYGSNDAPVVSAEVVLTNGTEDTSIQLSTAELLANATDVDHNDLGQLSIANLVSNHGIVIDNKDGTFTFTPEKDYNGDVHFSYDVKDAHGGVTHTGATTNLAAVNDNPDVTPLTDSVSEGADNHHTLNLLLGATDKEGDALTISHLEYAIDGQPQAGKIPAGITLDADGHTLIVDATDPAFNHLANGQSQQIAITYQVEDGHGGSTQQTATLTIAGTDDKATLVSNVIQLTETQALDSEFKSYRGLLQLIDPDSGDNTQFVFSGKYLGQGFEPGHLDVWPNGTYQFRLDAGTNRHADDLIGSLHAGESKEFPYEVETSDGQKLTIMVKVTGEDNQAKIVVTPYSSLNNHVYEDHTSFGNTTHQLSSGGTLHVIDPDHDQAGFIAQTITTTEGGRFNINAQGHWSYNIDNDKVQHLGAGESFQQTFTVESIDGSAKKDITVTVHGTNDVPIVASVISGQTATEDGAFAFSVPAGTFDDIDAKDSLTLSAGSLPGWLSFDPTTGTFTGTPTNSDVGTTQVTVTATDAHGATVSTAFDLVVNNTNDAPTLNPIASVSVDEDGQQATGQLSATDPDTGDSLTYSVASPVAGLTLNADGSYSFDPSNAAYQSLPDGQTQTVTIPVTVTDSAGATDTQKLTITMTGTNDVARISGVDTGTATEDSVSHGSNNLIVSGQLRVADVDSGEGMFTVTGQSNHQAGLHERGTPVAGDHGLGQFVVHANGTWTFIADNTNLKIQALAEHQTIQETFTVHSKDGTAHTITVDIVGTDDKPVVSGAVDLGSTAEDTTKHFSAADLLANTTDADGDALSIVDGSVTAEHGTLSGDAVHGFVFTPDANYHGTDIAITFTATDGHSTVAGTATLDVTATNDATKVVATSASTTEDTDIVLTKSQLLAGATDVDGDTLDINSVTVNGGHGTVTDNHDGTWTLHPEENYKGDITLGYKVNDGTADVDNHMTVAVTSVTDAADINLSVAPPKGFQTDSAHHLSIDAILNPDGGGDHTARDDGNSLTFEMGITLDKSETYHNGDVIAQYGGHISSPGKLDYAQMHYYSDGSRIGNGGVTLTNPHSVTVWISGMDPIETHIDITDGKLHRLTVVVDEGQGNKAPTMSIFDNGKPVDYPDGSNSESMPTHYLGDSGSSEHYLTAPKAGFTITENGFLEASTISIPYGGGHANVPTSLTERAGSTELVIGTGRSPISLGDGRYATGYDHGHIVWSHGSNHDGGNVPPITPIVATIEHVTVVKEAVAASQVAQGPLGEQGLDPKHVLIDLGVNGAGIVDHTGLHSTVVPSGSDHSHVINTAGINVTNDPHHLVINADVTPHDKDDALQAVHLHGLPVGSVVTDGAHTHTIDATDQKDGLDILGWTRSSIEVRIPAGVNHNAIITVEATTQNPDGTHAHSASSAPVILDPAHAGDVIVSAPPISGIEDKGPYDLSLTALDPSDPHAAITFVVSGLPAGATLSAGSYDTHTKTWTISPSETNGLQITLPKDFSGSVTPHITATSSAGHSHSVDVVGSITDTPDTAVISGTDSANITEDIHVQSSGVIMTNQNQLNVQDPDAGEALFTPTGSPSGSGSTATGSWVAGDKGIGQFILHADGRWLYKVDNDNTHINSLGDGDTFTETLTVQTKDGTTHQLTSTIHGTNDQPVIDATSAVTAIEGGHTAHKGQITTTDVDTGDSATYTVITPTTGQHVPGFTLNADGSYEFDATDAGYDHLALGKTEQVSVSVTVTDGAGATDQKDLIITITGTNDRPTVGSSLAQHIHSIDEDTTQHFSAKDFGFIDKDHGDQLDHITITALPDAFKGQFEYDGHPITIPLDVLTADISKLTFVPAQDYNGGVQFGFTVNDGHTDSFPKIGNFEIIPVDDISTVSGTDTLSMTEGSAANTHADLTVAKGAWLANVDGHFDFPEVVANDPNAGRWYAITGAGVAGGAAHGMKIETTQWVMNMGDPNYGHNGYMTFTRNTNSATASYNAVDRVEGDLLINDPDTVPATFIDVTDSLGDNGYGNFSMHNGHWSFVGGDKTTALADGEKATETFTFNTSDGVTHQVTVNLTGSDTKAEFKGDISANLKEGDIGDTVSAHGTLNIVDVDTGQNPIIADFHDKNGVNGYGHFSMVNNQWTYEIDQTTVQKLNASESVQDKITVTASDGTTQDIVISIRGTNDAPEVTGAVANTDDSEGHAIDMTLPSNLFTDVEGDSFTLSLAVSQHTEEAVNPDSVNPGWQGKDTALGMPTWLHFDEKTGRIWGTPPHSADGDLDITVTATDANGAKGTYDFHIAVTDVDAKGIAHANVNEDDRATGQHSANGQLDAYHNGQHIIWHEQATGQDSTPNMIQGKYGHLQISTGGTWIYYLDHDGDQHWANKDLNALKAGQVEQEHFTIHGLQNGKEVATEQVIIAVTGKNDGATINGTMTSKSVSTITEDAAKDTLAGHLNLVDADHGEDQFIPDPHIAGTYGHLELAANGDWVYHLDNSLATTNSLSAAQGGTETFTINSPDNTASHTITINVNGVDDPLTAVTSPAPPPPVQHDEPDFSAETSEDLSVTLDDVGLVVPDSQHQAVNDHPVTGAAAYLDALGITPAAPVADAPEHQLPADMDIVMAEANHAALGHDDVSHIDLSDALEHQGHEHDTNQQDHDDTQHHNQVDDLPDIDPNS